MLGWESLARSIASLRIFSSSEWLGVVGGAGGGTSYLDSNTCTFLTAYSTLSSLLVALYTEPKPPLPRRQCSTNSCSYLDLEQQGGLLPSTQPHLYT